MIRPPHDAYPRILAALGTPVLVLDGRGRVVEANPLACALLERPLRELLGRDVAEVLAPLDAIQESAAAKRAGGAPGRVGYRATEIDAGPDEPDAPRFAVVLHDVGGIERLRDERDRLMQLVGVSEALPAALHELKNPLAAVAGTVELLLEEASPGAPMEELHSILWEVRRMTLTLEGLGTVQRPLSASRLAPIDFAIEEVCRILRAQASARRVEIETAVQAMPPLPLDPAIARAVTFNLVSNAVQACPGGGLVRVGARLVRAEGADTWLEVGVDDTGVGMTDEVRRRCFEPFFTTKPKGTGIGLALVSRVVHDAGGRIEVDSAVGRGTSIRLFIPVSLRPAGRRV